MEARNELESYAYSLKNQINDKEKLGGKLAEDDKKTVEEAVDEAIDWLGKNQEASVEELQEQKKVRGFWKSQRIRKEIIEFQRTQSGEFVLKAK